LPAYFEKGGGGRRTIFASATFEREKKREDGRGLETLSRVSPPPLLLLA